MHGWVEACFLHIWRTDDSFIEDIDQWLKISKAIYFIMLLDFSHQRSIMLTIKQIVHIKIVQIYPYSFSA